MAIVYLITHRQTGKVYVGYTTQRYACERWKKHLYCARQGVDTHLYRAIRKYGPQAFSTQVLADQIDRTQAIELEKLWIILLQANLSNYGYNTTTGGEAPRHTPETKAKISNVQRGRVQSAAQRQAQLAGVQTPEYRAKRRHIAKGLWQDPAYRTHHVGDNHWTRRLGHSEETRKKISEGLRKAWTDERH